MTWEKVGVLLYILISVTVCLGKGERDASFRVHC